MRSSPSPASPPEAAELHLVSLRWPDGATCPRCGGGAVAARARRRLLRWRCRHCRADFTVTSGTPLHGSKIDLARWVEAADASDCRPAALSRLLGLSPGAARRIARTLEGTGEPPGRRRLAALVARSPPTGDNAMRRWASDMEVGADAAMCMSSGRRAVLAVLRGRLGGATAGRVAAETRLSPGHARRCLRELARGGFVKCSDRDVLWGYGTRSVRVWELDRTEQTLRALPGLPWLHPLAGEAPPGRIPAEFWYLFWSGSSAADLRLPDDALAVADALIGGPDPAARAWALTHLPTDALRLLRSMRGYDGAPAAAWLDATLNERADALD